jgi:glycosyltransferase involved in cell wall biosynthesis
MELPFVTAIMPTANRRQYALEAIQMFLEQDYPLKEIVVLDDGTYPLNPPVHELVRYEHSPVRRNVGKKRNMACSRATGDVIVHWDDDDIYSPDRISDQVERLIANPELQMTGYHSMLFVEPSGQEWLWRMPNDLHAIGVSFCYWKSIWRLRPFPECESGEDLVFWSGRKCLSVDAERRIVARIHTANTSYKDTSLDGWERVA